jgi:hypothetical protein
MDSLQDILGNKHFTRSSESSLIKEYIKRRFDSKCTVKIDKTVIIVSVPNSALAATIYLERQNLIEQCGLKQRLVVRTGR